MDLLLLCGLLLPKTIICRLTEYLNIYAVIPISIDFVKELISGLEKYESTDLIMFPTILKLLAW